MLNVRRPSSVTTLVFSLFAALAGVAAQSQTPPTALDHQLSRIDIALSGVGIFNHDSHGTASINAQPTAVTLTPGNTLGALITVRYIVKPYVGFEGNYGYSRYTQTFTPFGAQPTGGVQQNASEYTLGYVAHPPTIFGLHPFVGAGLGTIAFRPTPGGGLSLLTQARAAYYYAAGVDATLPKSPHFGFRAQIRQSFFLAPDFETNYLTIKQHTTTFEPGVGFFIKF
jgi:hypothetical protein